MNKYQVLEKIGEGQYGEVIKSRNKQTGEIVAIKKFKDDDNDEEAKKIILREVKILKMMKHNNITEFKDAFRKKGRVYLVCEFVEKNLLSIIEENRGIDRERLKEYLFQIFKGISYMHSLDLIHRDIKPQNILVNPDHSLKICDFGFTRVFPAVSGQMTEYVATRWYRPPELLLGISNYSQSVDVWAVGCLFGEMIDGQPVFPGQTQIDQLFLIQKLLGPLSPDQQELFSKNPKFVGMKFPQFSNTDSLQKRYLNKIGKDGMDLMKKILKMDPRQRITAQQALKHPFFTRLKSRLAESPVPSDYIFQRQKNTGILSNTSTIRDKAHINMLGINKIKGIVKQMSQQSHGNPKSRIMINANKQNNTSLPKNQKSMNQSKKQPIVLKKKSYGKETNNYVQQYDLQDFHEPTSYSKPKEVIRNKKKQQQDYQQDFQIEPQHVAPKTPILGKRKTKKKISKYDEDFDHPNLVFQRKRQDEQGGNVYNIIMNNNTFNYKN